eukprot:4651132-Ditylum_brightwellii.AAC.1
MNHWLTVVPHTDNNSVLRKDMFSDVVMLQYKLIPKDMLEDCDGHRKKHSLQCALQHKTGGLIGSHHNDYRDDMSSIASQVFSPSAIHNNPVIPKGWDGMKK